MAGQTIDYDALAKQNGAISSQPAQPAGQIDYEALAKQNGATSSTPAPPAGRSVGGFLSNVGSSAMKFGSDVVGAVAHPIDTLGAIGSIPVGLAEKAIGREIGTREPGDTSPTAAQKLDALMDHFKGRYGSLEGVKKALYEDPVGVAADVSTLFGGAGEVADAAKLGKVAKVASTASEVTDPLRMAGKGVSAVAGAADRGAGALADSLRRGALKGGYTVATDSGKVADAANTMRDAKIPLSEAGSAKITSALADLQQAKMGKVNAGAAGGLAIDPARVQIPLQDLRAKYANQVNPTADLKQIDAVSGTFAKNNPGPIPLDQAEALKEGTYKVNDYGKTPQHLVATAEAEKSLATGLRQELEYHMPELAGLNEQQGKLMNLQGILDKAVNKYTNAGGFMNSVQKGLGSNVSKTLGLFGGGAAASGHLEVATAAGAANFMQAVLSDPVVKSRLATAINIAQKANPSKWGTPGVAAATSRIEQLATGLSRANQKDDQQ